MQSANALSGKVLLGPSCRSIADSEAHRHGGRHALTPQHRRWHSLTSRHGQQHGLPPRHRRRHGLMLRHGIRQYSFSNVAPQAHTYLCHLQCTCLCKCLCKCLRTCLCTFRLRCYMLVRVHACVCARVCCEFRVEVGHRSRTSSSSTRHHPSDTRTVTPSAQQVCSYGLYSYGLHSYGLYSYGL